MSKVFEERYRKLWKKIQMRIKQDKPELILKDVHKMMDQSAGYQYNFIAEAAGASVKKIIREIQEK